jgi:hypothetical protein
MAVSQSAAAADSRRPASPDSPRAFPKRPPARAPGAGACVASKRYPDGIVIRQAAISAGRSSLAAGRRTPRWLSRAASAASPVTGAASCWARYCSTNSARVSARAVPLARRSFSSARSSAAGASPSLMKPPRCTRAHLFGSARPIAHHHPRPSTSAGTPALAAATPLLLDSVARGGSVASATRSCVHAGRSCVSRRIEGTSLARFRVLREWSGLSKGGER